MTLATEDGPIILRMDVFPATVAISSTGVTHAKARVFATTDVVYAYIDGQGGPQLLLEAPLVELTGDVTTGWVIQTDTDTLRVARAHGCGCGSQLRGFRPWGSRAVMMLPNAR